MRKIVLTLSLAFLGTFSFNSAIAQVDTKTTTDEPVENGAVISMDKDVHDYGTITQGDDGNCKFTITNNGTEPLIISLCKGSCGCTVPLCPQEPIVPGESAEISVKYNTNKVGPINRTVTITSNATNEQRKIIRIKGDVKAKPSGTAPLNNGGPTNN
jgi:Protein of unknown function (DUF1573)